MRKMPPRFLLQTYLHMFAFVAPITIGMSKDHWQDFSDYKPV